jgi:hypothetical protein
MAEAKDKMLDRVRALLTQAEDESVTPDEAQAFTAKATELMAKYGIDKAMAEARQEHKSTPGSIKIRCDNPYGNYKILLANIIAKAFGCEAIQLSSRNTDVRTLHVFGFESDLQAVEVLYTSVLLQAMSKSVHVPGWENTRTYRISFWVGFINTIAPRIEEAYGRAKADAEVKTPGTALVLVDRSLAVKAAYRNAYPRTRATRARLSAHSAAGVSAGKQAGQDASLHDRGQAGSGSRTALG